ncbi:hypothetical protein VF21_06005 [Pseudogymnoascus sp. 05NY08]|nr:hypothetical protein VF21_06005 [Pseudogymnoascus sp. 05NY08]
MKFYVAATILALAVGAMSAAVPNALYKVSVAIREAAAPADASVAETNDCITSGGKQLNRWSNINYYTKML